MTTLTHTSEIVDAFARMADTLVRGLAGTLTASRRSPAGIIAPRMAQPTLSDRMLLLQPSIAR